MGRHARSRPAARGLVRRLAWRSADPVSCGDAGAPEQEQGEMNLLPICSTTSSALQPKLARIAKVAVAEAVEKAETGDPVKSSRNGSDGNGAQVLVESERG